MKKLIPLLLVCALLVGCGAGTAEPVATVHTTEPAQAPSLTLDRADIPFVSRFQAETRIELSDEGVDISGRNSLSVFLSDDIVYYEDREIYESGNPYGEGEDWERHTEEEAKAHVVVNITAPGTYRVTGRLSAGQIRVDLGEDAYEDETAVVELILDNADITCTVAPAILFRNVYECDGAWNTDTAKPDMDTSAAGANLILEGQNNVSGSHVAKIFKDKDGEKKLWKQDGAIYSYMSMNVWGPGALTLNADNEGMDTELHLTINGGDIIIRSGNDGINTNEDGVSVTTINGGSVHIAAGLGAEGDGIDSNGYLVINGGVVVSSAHPAADAGLDSDLGSYIHGGTVIAMGSSMDWAESDSGQVTMNLQFASYQAPDASVAVTKEDGTLIFAYDPGGDDVLGENARRYQGMIISCGNLKQGDTYLVYSDDTLSGAHTRGIYNPSTVTERSGGTQMAYTGTDAIRGPGGMGDFGGQRPEGGWREGEMPSFPAGEMPDMENMPDMGRMPEGQEPPEGFGGNWGGWGEGEIPSFPAGEMPDMGQMPEGQGFPGGFGGQPGGEANTRFYMLDKVNFFTGLTAVQ